MIVPLTQRNAVTKVSVGTRIVPAASLYGFLDARGKTYSPSLADTKTLMSDPDAKPYGWRLEHFIADLLLGCRQGYRYMRDDDIPIELCSTGDQGRSPQPSLSRWRCRKMPSCLTKAPNVGWWPFASEALPTVA